MLCPVMMNSYDCIVLKGHGAQGARPPRDTGCHRYLVQRISILYKSHAEITINCGQAENLGHDPHDHADLWSLFSVTFYRGVIGIPVQNL